MTYPLITEKFLRTHGFTEFSIIEARLMGLIGFPLTTIEHIEGDYKGIFNTLKGIIHSTCTYNDDGELILRDDNGFTTECTYNAEGKLHTRIYNGDENQTYTRLYDENGRAYKDVVSDDHYYMNRFEGQCMTSEMENANILLTRDHANNIISEKYKSGYTYSYLYDEQNRIISVNFNGNGKLNLTMLSYVNDGDDLLIIKEYKFGNVKSQTLRYKRSSHGYFDSIIDVTSGETLVKIKPFEL